MHRLDGLVDGDGDAEHGHRGDPDGDAHAHQAIGGSHEDVDLGHAITTQAAPPVDELAAGARLVGLDAPPVVHEAEALAAFMQGQRGVGGRVGQQPGVRHGDVAEQLADEAERLHDPDARARAGEVGLYAAQQRKHEIPHARIEAARRGDVNAR